jgi:hypothetical protein
MAHRTLSGSHLVPSLSSAENRIAPKGVFVKQLFLGTLCLALIPSPAYAKPHGDKGDKHEKSEKHGHDRDDWHHRDHGRKDYDHHGASARPAGWDKGKKTGWGGCDVPPGQAKKVGCHPDRRDHHHDYHHDVRHRERHDGHRDDHRPRPVYTHHPRPNGTTTTTTTTTTTNKGEHPFSPVLRQKQEDERRRREEEARLRQTK